MARQPAVRIERRARGSRLGFRLDRQTKALVERAARLEHRSVTDFCLTALSERAKHIISEREALILSSRDREAFFDVLVHPPKPNAKLRAALKIERKKIAP